MDDPAAGPDDSAFDHQFRLLIGVVWIAGLAVAQLRGYDVGLYLLLSAYVLGILYARHLHDIGDPEGGTAIWWAVVVPPLAWWTFLLHWLEHRGPRSDHGPAPGPGPEDADLGYGPGSEDDGTGEHDAGDGVTSPS